MSPGQVAAAAWIALAWVFMIATVGGYLLHRWYARERRDAAETDAVMAHLSPATDDSHIWDVI